MSTQPAAGHPTALLQPQTEAARKASGVDYIVAFSPTGIRWTHPDTRLIGKHVVGNAYRPSHSAKPHTSTFTSALGPAVNTTVPVVDRNGSTAGFVSVGIRVQRTSEQVLHQLPLLVGSAAGGCCWSSAGRHG